MTDIDGEAGPPLPLYIENNPKVLSIIVNDERKELL